MNFLQKLPKAQRDILIRKATTMEAGQSKPATQAELVRDLLRRTLGRGKSYLTREEEIDYEG